jgi:hypothetical protein
MTAEFHEITMFDSPSSDWRCFGTEIAVIGPFSSVCLRSRLTIRVGALISTAHTSRVRVKSTCQCGNRDDVFADQGKAERARIDSDVGIWGGQCLTWDGP